MSAFHYAADGVRLQAVQQGAGPLVVLLHGGGASHHAVLPYAAPLADRYRVVTPDLRGSGRSWCAEPLSWDRLADDVAALLDHLGAERAVVGGASLGASAALRFALKFPERAAGLMLVTPAHGGIALTTHQAQALGDMAARLEAAGPEGLEGLEGLRPLYQATPALSAYFDAVVGSWDLASLRATAAFMASGAQPIGAPDDLAAVAVPTLLTPGDDPMHPAEISALYAARIPRCVVAGAGETGPIGGFCDRLAPW
jgi:3-oxoadipate enol-lactonase